MSPQRIAVVGYADQHPIASNANPAGMAQNRRVEVLITPNQVRTAGPGEGAPARAGKDAAATIDRGPSFNK